MITPLLSEANIATGFCNCCARAACVGADNRLTDRCNRPLEWRPERTRRRNPAGTRLRPAARWPRMRSTVFSGGPLFEQLRGIVGKAGSPMIWIGTEFACSPTMWMSATRTDPQLKPSTNWAHSASGLPVALTLLRKRQRWRQRRRDDPQSGRSGVDLDVIDGLAIAAGTRSADGDAGEDEVRNVCRSTIDRDGLHVLGRLA